MGTIAGPGLWDRDWEQIGANARICTLIYENTSPPDLQLPLYLQLLLAYNVSCNNDSQKLKTPILFDF